MGFEGFRCTAPDAGGFAAGDVLRGAAPVLVRVNPFSAFSFAKVKAVGEKKEDRESAGAEEGEGAGAVEGEERERERVEVGNVNEEA